MAQPPPQCILCTPRYLPRFSPRRMRASRAQLQWRSLASAPQFMLAPPLPLNGSMADTIALNLNPNRIQVSMPPASVFSMAAVSAASGGGHYAIAPCTIGVKPTAASGARATSRTITLRPPKNNNRHAMDTSMTTVSSVAEELAGVLDPLKHQPLVPLLQLLGSPTDNSSSDAAAQMHGGGAGRGDAPSHAPRAEPGSSEGCTTDAGICHFTALPPNPNEPREAVCEVPLYNPTGASLEGANTILILVLY